MNSTAPSAGKIAADPEGSSVSCPGSGKSSARRRSSWYETRAVRDLHVELAPTVSPIWPGKIHARFGDKAMRTIREDPYSLTEIDGSVSPGRHDRDCRWLPAGIRPPGPGRRLSLLGEAERRGHTHLPPERTGGPGHKAARLPPEPESSDLGFGSDRREDRIYRQSTLDRECWLAGDLGERAAGEQSGPFTSRARTRNSPPSSGRPWPAPSAPAFPWSPVPASARRSV